MNTLQATVEIVKAALQSADKAVFHPEEVAELIGVVYKKLKEVQV